MSLFRLLTGLTVVGTFLAAVPVMAQQKRIAFSVSDAGHPFYSEMVKGVENAGKEKGYEVMILDAQKKSEKQLSDAEDALSRGIGAILINGVDQSAIQVVRMAKDAGIPVIMLQRDYGGETADVFIGTDNVEVGAHQAKWFGEQFADRDKFNVLFITGIPGAASAEGRITGVERELPNQPHINVVAKQTGEYDRAKSLTVVENLLQSHPDVDGIIASNDEMAMGALAAVRAQGKDDVAIIGIDGNGDTIQAIDAGMIYATLAFSPFDIGRQGVEAAQKLMNDEDVPSRIVADVVVVTKENAKQHMK